MRIARPAQPTAAQQTRKPPAREATPLEVARALARNFAETKLGANGDAHSAVHANSRECIDPSLRSG
jgi:hypothetical protein